MPKAEEEAGVDGAGRGMMEDNSVSRCRRRMCKGERTFERISTLIVRVQSCCPEPKLWLDLLIPHGQFRYCA
jgi:hypothetical protein